MCVLTAADSADRAAADDGSDCCDCSDSVIELIGRVLHSWGSAIGRRRASTAVDVRIGAGSDTGEKTKMQVWSGSEPVTELKMLCRNNCGAARPPGEIQRPDGERERWQREVKCVRHSRRRPVGNDLEEVGTLPSG